MIRYAFPPSWISYRAQDLAQSLAEAKAAIMALQAMPYRRAWVEELQKLELKMEVAGTSRIEGAEFTQRELDLALAEPADKLLTRSQRQASAALETYRWIATLPLDRPITVELLREIHARIVTGADDDHCPPGRLRDRDENVTFGTPRHRGCEGGEQCRVACDRLTGAIEKSYREHDPLIQALAAHYHVAAMHPFLDGNGRTARALEALMLQRAGLRDTCFIAMSNYYYEEKTAYLSALAQVRADHYDLTAFLKFALRGIALQARRLLDAIQVEMRKALYRDLMHELFGRLRTPKKRVIAKRQLGILSLLLQRDELALTEIIEFTKHSYAGLTSPFKAVVRDLNQLLHLGAIEVRPTGTPEERHRKSPSAPRVRVNLSWPTQITETAFFDKLKELPKAKTSVLPL